MLSVPTPSSTCGAQISSKILATIFQVSSGLSTISRSSLYLRTLLQVSSLERQSQIPSQARIRNLSSSCFLLVMLTSGKQETAWNLYSRCFLSLYWKSPNALLRARFPSTLPSSTKCSAALILALSFGFSGL